MTVLLKGKEVAEKLAGETLRMSEALKKAGIRPGMAIVRVGERPDDVAYEQSAVKKALSAGVAVRPCGLPENVSQEDLLKTVRELNEDDSIHGILMFRPLPGHLDERAACLALKGKKDIDGITDASMSTVYSGSGEGFPPCTARACMEILDHYGIETRGKKAVIIGRSPVVGKPAAMMLLRRNATVTICHTKTEDLAGEARRADILLAAAGKAGVVGPEYTNPDQTVLDVGIHVKEDGSLGGDVDFERVAPLVKAITPVPGGIGAVTAAILISHVVEAARKRTETPWTKSI